MSDEPAISVEPQDITSRIEEKLYGKPQDVTPEPEELDDDEVLDDDLDDLPDDDDLDSDDDDGLKDLEDIAEDEELSLAEYLGVDEERIVADDDGNIALNTIVDGETKAVPLKDLVSSFQLQGHVNNKSIALENEKKEFENSRFQVANDLKEKMQNADALTQVLEEQVTSEFNSIDWNKLRHESPAEWSALRQEFSERANKIQTMQQNIRIESEGLATKNNEEFQYKMQVHLNSEMNKMIVDNPDWSDDVVREVEQTKLKTFLTTTYGFTEEDMASVSDHRLMRVLQDAKKYREGSKGVQEKKVKKVPKFRKPGASKAKASAVAKARSVKAKRDAVKKGGGKTADIANLILDRM